MAAFIDGAHEGLSARAGMELAIGGGEEPKAQWTPAEMEAHLLAPDDLETVDDYSEAARRCARFILLTMRAHPEIQQAPTETVYDWTDFHGEGIPPIVQAGWDDLLRAADPEGYATATHGLSGFMWGWAVNAARYVLGLRRTKNPAIVEVKV